MRRAALAAVAIWTACAAHGMADRGASRLRSALEQAFVPARELRGQWQVVPTADEPPPEAELRAQGLRATAARHYARMREGASEACSVELWEFDRAEQARAVAAAIRSDRRPVLEAGSVLVLLRGAVLVPGGALSNRLVPECARLGARVVERLGGERP